MYSMKPVLRTVLYEKKIVLKESVYFYIDLKKKKRYTHTYGQDELKIMRNDKKGKKMLILKNIWNGIDVDEKWNWGNSSRGHKILDNCQFELIEDSIVI